MRFLDNLKISLAKYHINKIKVDNERVFYNFENIKTIHILYYLNVPENIDAKKQYKLLYSILDNLKKLGKRANLTYFVDDTMMEAAKMNVTPLSITDFKKWTLQPREETLNGFMYEDHDVLLNLSPVTCWQLEYLAQYSKAAFKIGVQHKEQGARYDFLFKPDEGTSFPFEVYEQIVKYLQIINK
ncbi:MAG: hypothetical protein MJ010_02975 [Paludibacteraceae bacterium]|nr:hypothetical protein [Paludibacteraceae bacterium]